jgi:hypothetical protein
MEGLVGRTRKCFFLASINDVQWLSLHTSIGNDIDQNSGFVCRIDTFLVSALVNFHSTMVSEKLSQSIIQDSCYYLVERR